MSQTLQAKVKKDALTYWTKRGFPYPEKNDEDFGKEYLRLSKTSITAIIGEDNIVRINPVGLRIVNFFHPQIWKIRVKDAYSPMDRFNDPVALKKIIEKSVRIWPNRKVFNSTYLRNAIRIHSKTRAVTNFRPAVAKTIIEKYSNDGDSVLDFCAGFGGRLLGCLTLKRHYYGVDPSSEQITGNNAILEYCRDSFEVNCRVDLKKDTAETHLAGLLDQSFSLVFSSPPYFDYERYSTEETQSHIKFSKYSTWKDGFLRKVIEESYRLLKPEGYFVIHVKNLKGYPIEDDLRAIANDIFRLEQTLYLQTVSRPYRANTKKYEPILVFKKI